MNKNFTEVSPKFKIFLSVLAAFALPFTIAVCGVGEIYLNNSDEFLFVLSDLWGWSVGIGMIIFVALFSSTFLNFFLATFLALNMLITQTSITSKLKNTIIFFTIFITTSFIYKNTAFLKT